MSRNGYIAYMAAGLLMAEQELGLSLLPRKRRPETKFDKKKCKSCKYFRKEKRGCNCVLRGYVKPLDVACSDYQKRKRR